MFSLKKIYTLLCFLVLTSCYESLDFEQLDNYVSKPVFTSSLIYLKLLPGHFFDDSGENQQNRISDITIFKGFENEFLRDNTVKVDFNVEVKNEFDREVTFEVDLLNDNNAIIYSFVPIVVQSNDLEYTFFEEIIIAQNPNVLNTTKVRISVEIENGGDPLNPKDISEFELKSSMSLYVESGL